ncbi:MAG: calcineurin-like phosphoesterase C-terminal domain-containing protein [Fimbriimonadaceae bacterium]
MRRWELAIVFLPSLALGQAVLPGPDTLTARGVVFEDANGNGTRDERERGVGGVWVSNQRHFAKTDRQGKWQLPGNDDTVFYVVKPRGWMVPTDDHNVPVFYYVHKPKGSPPNLRHKGLEPTGPLPESIDFPLRRQKENDEFKALFFGDTQPRDLREVDYLTRDVFEPLYGKADEYDFGVTLGDVVFDDLSVTGPLVQAIGLIGIPWYYVLGNHDINYDVPDDSESDEHWHRYFGPNYYSFDHGPVHFVVLDNVEWHGQENAAKEEPPRSRGYYRAALGQTQMAWLREDLSHQDEDKLVVVIMHIPITEVVDREALYALLAERPYALSVSAHTHMQEHRFVTQADGWPKAEPHHHVINVTTCGSWWAGLPGPRGVPHTTMRDGAPPGYSVFTFDGSDYRIEFRAAGRPADYQMNITAPDAASEGFEFFVNVFGGSERSTVEYSFAGSEWAPMERTVEADPGYVELVAREGEVAAPFRKLPAAEKSTHLWKARLELTVEPGTHPLHVRTTDMFGQTYVTSRAIRVVRPG